MYTWRVIATDGLESSESDWWTFFTPEWSNEPPYTPADPHPASEDFDVQTTGVHLTWSAGDPDQDDVLTYDVYFGTGIDPGLAASGLTETSYALPSLDYDTVLLLAHRLDRLARRVDLRPGLDVHDTHPAWRTTSTTYQTPRQPCRLTNSV